MGVTPERERALLAFSLLALAMTYGCLPMAVPPALSLARAAISEISSSAHTAKNNQVSQDTETCDMGDRPLPELIELRTDRLGKTMYRTFKPSGPAFRSQARQAAGQVGGAEEWRTIRDLSGMNFQPSLQSQLVPNSIILLAYAPTEARDPAEQSQLDALNHDFAPVGTFDWGNRLYVYSVVHQLPCESPRIPKSVQASGGFPRPDSPEEPEQPQQPRPLTR